MSCNPRKEFKDCSTTSESTESVIIRSECEIRRDWKGEKKIRSLKTYSLDTCLISYKPRLLYVPSDDYPCLDAALKVLEPYQGGYVIKLAPGVYTTEMNICNTVDNLTIIGDCNPFAGVLFYQPYRLIAQGVIRGFSALPPPLSEFPYCETTCVDYQNLTFAIQGRTIRVTGCNRELDFSQVSPDSLIYFFDRAGTLYKRFVKSVCRNSITVDSDIPIVTTETNDIYDSTGGGQGFFFSPNVIITSSIANLDWNVSGTLTFRGLTLDVPFAFNVYGAVEFKAISCHIANNLTIHGQYDLTCPNVATNLIFLFPGANGEARHQGVVSAYGHVEGYDMQGIWQYCAFVSTIHAVELKSAGNINFFGSTFDNNCLALSVDTQSHGTLNDARFTHNIYGLLATNQSQIASVPLHIPSIPQSTSNFLFGGPWFVRNIITMIAAYHSFIIMPNTNGIANEIPFIIDGKLYVTVESNPVGIVHAHGSMVTILPNPFAPDPIAIGCITANNIPAGTGVSGVQLSNIDTYGVVSPSFIQDVVGVGPNHSLAISAADTLSALSSGTTSSITTVSNRIRYFVGLPATI